MRPRRRREGLRLAAVVFALGAATVAWISIAQAVGEVEGSGAPSDAEGQGPSYPVGSARASFGIIEASLGVLVEGPGHLLALQESLDLPPAAREDFAQEGQRVRPGRQLLEQRHEVPVEAELALGQGRGVEVLVGEGDA